MRNLLTLALATVATLSFAACSADDGQQIVSRKKTPKTSQPAEGETQDHDPNAASDEPGDPANPNSTSTPDKPATPGQAAGELGVTLSTQTPATDLGTKTDITVTVEPKAGFKGEAQLSVAGLPAGATAAFSPASVTLNTTPVTSKLTITVPTTAAPSPSGGASALVVTAKSGAITATANANFKVNPKLTMTIPMNADALRAAVGTRYVDGWAGPAFGTQPEALQTQQGNPITIVVLNEDSKAHIVHGNAGFAHGDTGNPVAPGATDPKNRTVAVGANTSGYLHDGQNGTSVSFRISVKAAGQ